MTYGTVTHCKQPFTTWSMAWYNMFQCLVTLGPVNRVHGSVAHGLQTCSTWSMARYNMLQGTVTQFHDPVERVHSLVARST